MRVCAWVYVPVNVHDCVHPGMSVRVSLAMCVCTCVCESVGVSEGVWCEL